MAQNILPNTQAQNSEFTVENAYIYNHSGAVRWILSHLWRYKFFLLLGFALFLFAYFTFSYSRGILIGNAAEEIINPTGGNALVVIGLTALILLVADGIASLIGSLSVETLAQRLERDSREELYISLLGKSQTFHDRQRVGDIMARATDDMRQLNMMVNPGILFIFDTIMGIVVPLTLISTIRVELILVPILFVVSYIITVRQYARKLNPVVGTQREKFGIMNAGLEETISGIEVVKASAREGFEREKFRRNARGFREFFVKQGYTEAGYLPLLLFGVALGLTFLHGLFLYQQGIVTVPDIIAVMALMNILRFPVFISIFSFSMVQLGIASAGRILSIIKAETELDENAEGHSAEMKGKVEFQNVKFSFEDGDLLEGISFTINPGETVAIVGQTGSGKSTLTELINRTYDVTDGRILIDGVDVREWNLTALRSQISKIEQDVFLFSRTLAENIAFGAPDTPQDRIEQAAKEAQAHDFILSFAKGYETEVGERGVTLSGGQRQRIALARAFLSNPRILILDDSTSAIDSATEDEIQKAIHRAQQGRTTLLITHRLSQIRWADTILVLDKGRLIAYGSHEELLRTSPEYRRIFARYEIELPPLEMVGTD
jgi:ATP-binding cassette subfamily B protein